MSFRLNAEPIAQKLILEFNIKKKKPKGYFTLYFNRGFKLIVS